MYLCTCVCVYARAYVCVCAHVRACVCAYVCIQILKHSKMDCGNVFIHLPCESQWKLPGSECSTFDASNTRWTNNFWLTQDQRFSHTWYHAVSNKDISRNRDIIFHFKYLLLTVMPLGLSSHTIGFDAMHNILLSQLAANTDSSNIKQKIMITDRKAWVHTGMETNEWSNRWHKDIVQDIVWTVSDACVNSELCYVINPWVMLRVWTDLYYFVNTELCYCFKVWVELFLLNSVLLV